MPPCLAISVAAGMSENPHSHPGPQGVCPDRGSRSQGRTVSNVQQTAWGEGSFSRSMVKFGTGLRCCNRLSNYLSFPQQLRTRRRSLKGIQMIRVGVSLN